MNSYWNPLAEKRDLVPAANKCVDRKCLDGVSHDLAVAPALIVIHTMVTSWQGAEARFMNAADPGHASATYGVKLDGGIVQWVDEKDAAYHAGDFAANMDSIGIEHEDGGDYNGPRTPELYAASSRLLRDLSQRYGIPLVQISRADYEAGRSGVIAHRDISDTPTGCPDSLDVARIISLAQGADDLTPEEHDKLIQMYTILGRLFYVLELDQATDPTKTRSARLEAIEAKLDALKPGALSSVDSVNLSKVASALDKLRS